MNDSIWRRNERFCGGGGGGDGGGGGGGGGLYRDLGIVLCFNEIKNDVLLSYRCIIQYSNSGWYDTNNSGWYDTIVFYTGSELVYTC
jgi:hypothetical protein